MIVNFVRLAVVVGAVLYISAGVAEASDADAVRALFERQVKAENAHDAAGFSAVFAPAPEYEDTVILVSRAGKFTGRKTVLARFEAYFKGTWKLDLDWPNVSVTRLGPDSHLIVAPMRITLGAPGKEVQTLPFLVNEVAIRTPQGWRITFVTAVLQQQS